MKQYWKECDFVAARELLDSKYHEVRLSAVLILVKKYQWSEKHDLGQAGSPMLLSSLLQELD